MALGSIRQAVDETATVVAYQEFGPYGNPVVGEGDPYGYTGEWWEEAVGLLHLRARWYAPEMGTFLSVDPVETEPPYQYVGGNVVNWMDPSGYSPIPKNPCQSCRPGKWNNGYSEFSSHTITFLRPMWMIEGTELVFNYRTLEVAEFELQVEPPPSIRDDIQFDIGILSWDLVWGMNFINGFSDRGVLADYEPSVRQIELGASAGYIFHGQAMGHGWGHIGGLNGYGATYGLEASLFDLIVGFTMLFGPLPPDFGPEFATYNASTTNGRVLRDFGDVCNKQHAQNFLNDLQTRSGYGLSPLRSSAVFNFKDYVQISAGYQIP